MSTDDRPTLRESIAVSLDSHGMKALLGLPDDEFDCCVAELLGVFNEWLAEQVDAAVYGVHDVESKSPEPSVIEYAEAVLTAVRERIEAK